MEGREQARKLAVAIIADAVLLCTKKARRKSRSYDSQGDHLLRGSALRFVFSSTELHKRIRRFWCAVAGIEESHLQARTRLAMEKAGLWPEPKSTTVKQEG